MTLSRRSERRCDLGRVRREDRRQLPTLEAGAVWLGTSRRRTIRGRVRGTGEGGASPSKWHGRASFRPRPRLLDRAAVYVQGPLLRGPRRRLRGGAPGRGVPARVSFGRAGRCARGQRAPRRRAHPAARPGRVGACAHRRESIAWRPRTVGRSATASRPTWSLGRRATRRGTTSAASGRTRPTRPCPSRLRSRRSGRRVSSTIGSSARICGPGSGGCDRGLR